MRLTGLALIAAALVVVIAADAAGQGVQRRFIPLAMQARGTSTPVAGPTPTRTATAISTPSPTPTRSTNCHPSYPDFCIPPPPPDLDCTSPALRALPGYRAPFRVIHTVPNPDPHRFDLDKDGLGCEPL